MSSVDSEEKTLQLKAGEYCVSFLPNKGMNFVSLKKGSIEALDQSTKPLFKKHYAGLGAMIGPHFHHRKFILPVKEIERFPHSAYTQGGEPFSHGIGRYAPWKVDFFSENQVTSTQRGEDIWNGVALKDLEGQDFTMCYEATVTPEGLEIQLSVSSETESVIGLHTYYALTNGRSIVTARVRDHYNDQGTIKPMPSTWNYRDDHTLVYPLTCTAQHLCDNSQTLSPHKERFVQGSDEKHEITEPSDFGFQPYPNPLHGVMELETQTHGIRMQYWCNNEENSIQLWHPQGASFACMEPLSAKDPRKPRLTVSQLKILISVL